MSNYCPKTLASVAFDNSIRVWDLQSNSLKHMFEDRQAKNEQDKVIMCLSWYNSAKITDNDPAKKLCLVGTAHGVLKLVDLDKNKIIYKETFSENDTLYSSDWSQQGFIVVGG